MSPGGRNLGREIESYNQGCFVCGEKNPSGMQLKFAIQGDKYVTEFVVADTYQGFPGIMHGGIISTVLDEVMGRFLWIRGYTAYTAEMTIRFRRPITCGSKVRFEGEIQRITGRRMITSARAVAEDGTVLAEATACFVSKQESSKEDPPPGTASRSRNEEATG